MNFFPPLNSKLYSLTVLYNVQDSQARTSGYKWVVSISREEMSPDHTQKSTTLK